MDLITIARRLREVYESIEDLLGSDERYEIEDILEELEQKIIHDDAGLAESLLIINYNTSK